MVYILSEDYWGFDPATRDDALNFYKNVWTLPKTQYNTMSDEDQRRKLYRCALFYVVDKTDNHGFTPIAIQSQGNTVIVAATAAGGGINRRQYDSGADSGYETGGEAMRQADPKATTFDELQDMPTSTPGKFKIEEFIFDDESAIKSKVEELQEELGQINAAESYAAEAPADVALDSSEPLIANPTTAAIAGSNLITDVQDTSLNLFSEEMNLPNSNLPGLPVVANNFGESSALMSGNSVPQWYGADGELTAADKVAMKRSRNMQSKMRGINRRNARKYKREMGAEIQYEQVGGQDALGVGLPVISNDFGQDSAGGSGHGVPQSYGAEGDMTQLMTSNALGQAGTNYDHEIHYRADELAAEDFPGLAAAEQTMALSSALPGLPVVPNDFGQDSSLSGNGVPQWYGAESSGQLRFTTGFSRELSGNQKMLQNYEVEYSVYSGNKWWTTFAPEYRHAFQKLIEKDIMKNLNADYRDELELALTNKTIFQMDNYIEYLGPNGEEATIEYDATFMPNEIISETVDGSNTFYEDRMDFEAQGTGQFGAEVMCITCNRGFPTENGIRRGQGWECLACSKGESWAAEGRKRRYGKRQRFDHIKGNSRYLARNAKGEWISNVGVSGSIKADLRNNAKTEQPVGFRGLGDANVRRAEAAPSVIDAAEPLEYIPYEFADEMDVGEYISSDDFMVLLAETVDGMALRYKPPMYRSPLAMAGAGAILAVVGMKLLKK